MKARKNPKRENRDRALIGGLIARRPPRPKQGSFLPKEEFIRLANRYQDCGDVIEQRRISELIIRTIEPLIYKIALSLRRSAGWDHPEDEVVQAGRIGVVHALRAWDREKAAAADTGFLTYSAFWIQAEMRRSLLKEARGTISLPVQKMTEKQRGDESFRRPTAYVSWDEPAQVESGDDGEISKGEFMTFMFGREGGAAGLDLHEDIYMNSLKERLHATIGSSLSARDAAIMRRCWFDEEPLASIARDLGISRERVRQIESAAVRSVASALAAQGFDVDREMFSAPRRSFKSPWKDRSELGPRRVKG